MSFLETNEANDSTYQDDGLVAMEKQVLHKNIALILATGLTASTYSYFMVDKNVNNAVTRGLYMAVISFIGASVVQVLEDNAYLDSTTSTPRYVEALATGLIYYYARRKSLGVPDVNSPALRIGLIAGAVGQLLTPMISKWLSKEKKQEIL